MKQQFYGARLKVDRARYHTSDLYRKAATFMAANPYVVHIDRESDARGDVLKLEGVAAFPDPLLLVLGDALHNLRSALDHALIATAVNSTEHTKFPIRNTAEELRSAVKGGLKDCVPGKVVKYIVDVVQPY